MIRAIVLIFVLLVILTFVAGCQTTGGLPYDAAFPEVPQDIQTCSKRAVVAVPKRQLTEQEVEAGWKGDRYTVVVLRQCLRRLIKRDQTLAGKKERTP